MVKYLLTYGLLGAALLISFQGQALAPLLDLSTVNIGSNLASAAGNQNLGGNNVMLHPGRVLQTQSGPVTITGVSHGHNSMTMTLILPTGKTATVSVPQSGNAQVYTASGKKMTVSMGGK